MFNGKHETETGSEFISPTHVRHIMRYVNCLKFLNDGDYILDAACGTGYGSYIVATSLLKCYVTGIDFCQEALDFANENYKLPGYKTRFERVNLLEKDSIKNASIGTVDAVLSIETIEHFERKDIDTYIDNILYPLKPGGKFIVSTPYSEVSGPSPITLQHLYEFNIGELIDFLVKKNLLIKEIDMKPHPGKAGRLGYCTVFCTKV